MLQLDVARFFNEYDIEASFKSRPFILSENDWAICLTTTFCAGVSVWYQSAVSFLILSSSDWAASEPTSAILIVPSVVRPMKTPDAPTHKVIFLSGFDLKLIACPNLGLIDLVKTEPCILSKKLQVLL